MTSSPDHAAIARSIRGRALAAETPCRRCGYDLQGLRPADDCPECGLPVETTTLAALLRRAEAGSVAAARPPRRRLRLASVVIGVLLLAVLALLIAGLA